MSGHSPTFAGHLIEGVFKFSNTGMGFRTFLRWTEELMKKAGMKKVIVGCEPTGCYWLTFRKFLQEHDVQLVTACEAARLEIWVLVNDYILKAEQLKRFNEYLEEKVKEVPNVEKLLAIKEIGLSTMTGFVAEVGDIRCFTDAKQIQKLAGLEIVKKSSGKKKGQPRISKRGRRKLRRTMYESARALMNRNPAFQDVFLYYRNREKNPLGGMQAKMAVAFKAIRVFYVVLQTGCDFDEEKFRKDIIRPEAV